MIREAKRDIEEHGWWKGQSEGPQGQICIGEALFHQGINCYHPLWVLAETIGCKLFPNRGLLIPAINDHPDTTRENIDLWLDKAAAEAGELPL